MKYRASRSPPRNFKVNLIDEPPFSPPQRQQFMTLVPKIAKTCASAEDNQVELSQELCRLLQQGVGVSVIVKPDNFNPDEPENYPRKATFRFTLNEFLYRVWLHQEPVQFEASPFGEVEQSA